MDEDIDAVHLQARKRQVSWDRAEKARLALTPYLQEIYEYDVRFALTDFLADVFHLAHRDGINIRDEKTIRAILDRSMKFFDAEEPEQYIPTLGKLPPKK